MSGIKFKYILCPVFATQAPIVDKWTVWLSSGCAVSRASRLIQTYAFIQPAHLASTNRSSIRAGCAMCTTCMPGRQTFSPPRHLPWTTTTLRGSYSTTISSSRGLLTFMRHGAATAMCLRPNLKSLPR